MDRLTLYWSISACNDSHFSDGCKRRRTRTYVFFYNAATVRTDELCPSFFLATGWSHQEPQNSSPILISSKPIFLRFIVFFTVHLLKVSHGETETELFWGSWWDQPVL